MPLIDVGVAIVDKDAIDMGKNMGVFLKDTKAKTKESLYIGTVWPGRVHYVDYLHPNSS